MVAYTPSLTNNLDILPIGEGEGYLLKIFLVQYGSNILESMRVLSVSNEMSNKVNFLALF